MFDEDDEDDDDIAVLVCGDNDDGVHDQDVAGAGVSDTQPPADSI